MKANSKIKNTDYTLPDIVKRLAELGLDESEISYSLSLTKRKFAVLKEQKDITNALAAGEESRARKVEEALFRRAVGFEYEEVVNAVSKPPATPLSPPFGKGGKSRTSGMRGLNNTVKNSSATASEKSSAKSTIKTVIPDVTACIFWLKNRQADKWRDQKDVTSGKKSLIEAMEDYDEESEN